MPPGPSDIFWAREIERLLEILLPLILRGAALGARGGADQLEAIAPGFAVDFGPVNAMAEQWARQHSFELVKGITDTTKETTRRIFGDWLAEGGTLPELEQRLGVHFDRNRARLIAVNETTEAFAEGNMTAWRASEVVKGKQWMTVGDADVDDPCLENERQGVIPLDQPFATGHQRPGAHIGCRCWLKPALEVDEKLLDRRAA